MKTKEKEFYDWVEQEAIKCCTTDEYSKMGDNRMPNWEVAHKAVELGLCKELKDYLAFAQVQENVMKLRKKVIRITKRVAKKYNHKITPEGGLFIPK